MTKRFSRLKDSAGGPEVHDPAKAAKQREHRARSEQRVAQARAKDKFQELINQQSAPFIDDAVTAFDTTFKAIFEQAVWSSTRLKKMRDAIDLIEDQLLEREGFEDLSPDTKVELYRTLNISASVTTRELMEISKTISQTRAIAQIMRNLRQIAAVQTGATYNGATDPVD